MNFCWQEIQVSEVTACKSLLLDNKILSFAAYRKKNNNN